MFLIIIIDYLKRSFRVLFNEFKIWLCGQCNNNKEQFSQCYIYNQNLLLNFSIFFYVNIDFTN